MMSLSELAERCEKATGPNRRLDAMIGAAVRAMPKNDPDAWLSDWPEPFVAAKFEGSIAAPDRNGNMVCHWEARDYTASLDAALTLVPEGAEWSKQYGFFEVEAPIRGKPGWVTSVPAEMCATDALGLCAAALKARAEAASADTHPEDGDVEQAPLVSGAIGEAETPKGHRP